MYTCDTNFPTHQSSLPPAQYCILQMGNRESSGWAYFSASKFNNLYTHDRVFFRETETIAKAPQDHRIGPHCPKKNNVTNA